ncbi:MAG TPA: hypothetical protein VLE73_05090 [Candidatus Saccharimonadales bacterium]|nr:hypothetical protein [Candidatus Saccharimonadales bacterium]
MGRTSNNILSASQALDAERSFDYIVAYPHSSNIEHNNGQVRARLSALSRMSIEAANVVQNKYPNSKLILPGETCFEDTGLPDTTDLMVAHLGGDNEHFVPLHRTADKRPLNNTYLQTIGVLDFLDQLPITPHNILIETLAYHVKRVRRTAEAYGLQAQFVAAEDIFAHQNNTEYERLGPVIAKGTRKTEALAYLLTAGDRKGTVMNWLMAKAGARIVDVVQDPSGNLVFENTLAMKKLARLTEQGLKPFTAGM